MAKQQTNATQQIKDKHKILVEIKQSADNLTKKDTRTWRNAWQMAARPDNPKRAALYDVYTDAMIDLHLTGCIGQRTGMVRKRSFKIVSQKNGKEDKKITELFECPWFKEFLQHALDSIYYGYSLIQFNDISTNRAMHFEGVELVPRKNVVPEFGVIIENIYDDPLRKGYSYLHGDLSKWCIGVGSRKNLGLLLKVAPQSLSKKNMLAYWDAFGEIFGMPIRIARTGSRDPNDRANIEKMMQLMGTAGWALLPEGTDVQFMETTRGDAFNVYDKRIDRANSEISKGILLQTMTTDSGGSLAQSKTHLDILKDKIEEDADFIRDVVNWKLIPLMEMHGFPVQNMRFDWDDSVDWTPEQQLQIEQMLLGNYDIDPKYFVEKYNIPVLNVKSPLLTAPNPFFA